MVSVDNLFNPLSSINDYLINNDSLNTLSRDDIDVISKVNSGNNAITQCQSSGICVINQCETIKIDAVLKSQFKYVNTLNNQCLNEKNEVGINPKSIVNNQCLKTKNEGVKIPKSTYLNLSSNRSFDVLDKGLTFAIPHSPVVYNKLLFHGLKEYMSLVNAKFRDPIRLHNVFSDSFSSEFDYTKFKKLNPKPVLIEKGAPPIFETLIKKFGASVAKEKRNWSNLTNTNILDLKFLLDNKDIVVTRMDKAPGFVVLDSSDYKKIGLKIFINSEAFVNVTNTIDPITILKKLQALNNNIFRHLLKNRSVNQNMFDLSQVPCVKFSTTYLLIKTHRALDDDNYYPARPIISGRNTIFKYLDEWLEFVLYPLLSLIPSKIRNNVHLLNKVKNMNFCRDTEFATLDAIDMYPSINQFECATKVKITIEENVSLLSHHLKGVKLQLPPSEYILFLILTVLRNSIFTFDKNYYQRRRGISMGSNISVLLSEIFIWRSIEEKLNLHHLGIALWGRFIDDIFLVSHNTNFDPSFVLAYVQDLSSLKFTKEGPSKTIDFLDLSLTNKGGVLVSKPFYKKTRVAAFLHFNSNHSISVKKAIILQKLHKLKAISSSSSIFESEKIKFESELLNRQYPQQFILNEFKKVEYHSVNSKNKGKKVLCGVPLVLPYDKSTYQPILKNLNIFRNKIKKCYFGEEFILKVMPKIIFKNSPVLSSKLFKARKLISVLND